MTEIPDLPLAPPIPDEAARLRAALTRTLLEQAIREAGGRPRLLLPLLEPQVRLDPDSLQLRPAPTSGEGEAPAPAAMGDWLKALASDPELRAAFPGPAAPSAPAPVMADLGGGQPPAGLPDRLAAPVRAEMSLAEKSAFISRHGLEAYLSLG